MDLNYKSSNIKLIEIDNSYQLNMNVKLINENKKKNKNLDFKVYPYTLNKFIDEIDFNIN